MVLFFVASFNCGLTVSKGLSQNGSPYSVFIGYWSRESKEYSIQTGLNDGNQCGSWTSSSNFDGAWYFGRIMTVLGAVCCAVTFLYDLALLLLAYPSVWLDRLTKASLFNAVASILLLVGLASDVCSQEHCKISRGGYFAIVACVAWLIAAAFHRMTKTKEDELGGGGYMQRPRIMKSNNGDDDEERPRSVPPPPESKPKPTRNISEQRLALPSDRLPQNSQPDHFPTSIVVRKNSDDGDQTPISNPPKGPKKKLSKGPLLITDGNEPKSPKKRPSKVEGPKSPKKRPSKAEGPKSPKKSISKTEEPKSPQKRPSKVRDPSNQSNGPQRKVSKEPSRQPPPRKGSKQTTAATTKSTGSDDDVTVDA